MARKLKYETELSTLEAAHKLSELCVGLAVGRIGLRSGPDEIVCHPGSVVRMRIDVKESSEKGRLDVELHWWPVRLHVSNDDRTQAQRSEG